VTPSLPDHRQPRGNRAIEPRSALRSPGKCQWCKLPIIWGRTAQRWGGRWIALDPEPHHHGDIVLLERQRALRIRDHRELLVDTRAIPADLRFRSHDCETSRSG